MTISRHNYEEYFLLYVDNELSVEEKKQVELFIRENPDLEEELVMLQQSRLVPDNDLVFEGKESLMKQEGTSLINDDNYQEWLVMVVDGELNADQRRLVQEFAASHPNAQQDLALFEKTKLQPEQIVFPDKQSLYRKERVTLISMQWWKVAVAAILVLAAGIGVYSILHSRSAAIATNTPFNHVKHDRNDSLFRITPSPGKPEPKTTNPDEHIQSPGQLQASTTKKEETVQAPGNSLAVNNSQPSDDTAVKTRVKVATEIVQVPINQPQISSVLETTSQHREIFSGEPVTNPTPEPPQQYASSTKKFRGFFRKATRIFEHTTNINPVNDDNRVLIGGMAINLR